MVTLGVVIASFVIGPDSTTAHVALGVGVIFLAGLTLGLVNAGLVRGLKIPSIIATLATLSILSGISLSLRDTPGRDHRSQLHVVAGEADRPGPHRVHRHRDRGGCARLLAARHRLGTPGALDRLRRAVGETERRPHHMGPGAGAGAVGAVRGPGVLHGDDALGDRERADRRQLRAEQHHRCGARWGRALRGTGDVPRGNGRVGAPGVDHRRAALPRPERRARHGDHGRPGAPRDHVVPGGRHQGARETQLQASPAPGDREPAADRSRDPGPLPVGSRFPRGADRTDADPGRNGDQPRSERGRLRDGRHPGPARRGSSRSGPVCRTGKPR